MLAAAAIDDRIFGVTGKKLVQAFAQAHSIPAETNWYLFCVIQPAIDVKNLYLLLSLKSAIIFCMCCLGFSLYYRLSVIFSGLKIFHPEFNDYAM